MTIHVHGPASDQDIAVVLAVLAGRQHDSTPQPTGYERWRTTRLAVVRPVSLPRRTA